MNFRRLRIVFAFAVLSLFLMVAHRGFSTSGSAPSTTFYRLVLLDDPATTMTIGYSAPAGARIKETKVYYGPKDMGTDPRQYLLSATPNSTNKFAGLQNYFVDLKGLTPDTNYYFVVTADTSVSKRFWFKTASASHRVRVVRRSRHGVQAAGSCSVRATGCYTWRYGRWPATRSRGRNSFFCTT